MELISCKNLLVHYGETVAIKDLSFNICENDYVYIVGENGSGKSTLLKTILGLKSPSRGEVVFKNFKKTEVGYLPQKTDVQKNFPATVEEVVFSGCVNRLKFFAFYSVKDREKVKNIMELLNLNDIKNCSFKKLSKGQQQKVLLARALCATKKILFLDEPCSSLDPVFRQRFYCLMKRLNEEEKMTIIMVSHDIKAAILNAKKILHIKQKMLFFGMVEEYSKSELAKEFLKGE